MSDKIRMSLLSLIIIIVLVFSAVSPTTAYADDGTTQQTTSTETTETESTEGSSGDGTTPQEAPVEGADTAAATEGTADAQPPAETAPVEGSTAEGATSTQPAGDIAPVEGAADSQPTVEAAPAEGEAAPAPDASVLSEVPADTAVTVLDANGEAQPLATQDAAQAIATSDPIWCPGDQSPIPETNGCTKSFDSFDALLIFLSGDPSYQGAGTIYVQAGAYNGNDPNHVIDFNSPRYNLSNINNSSLSIIGGWNISDKTINPDNPSTFNNYSMVVGSSTDGWGSPQTPGSPQTSVTIMNISMDLSGVTDPQVNGLTVYSDGSINLRDVSVSVSPNNGAELDADGDVNLLDTKFERNKKTGAVIRARGNVAVTNSIFGNPQALRGRRQHFGLDIVSGETTSLFGVIANHNRKAGVTIDSVGRVTIGSSFFNSTKSRNLNGSNPEGYGLQVKSLDAIDVDGVTANDNFLWGVKLDAGKDIAVSNSEFIANSTYEPGFIDDTGLFIIGGQNVALNNVTANDNRLYGVQIIDVTGIVSVNNSTFNNNRGEITPEGTVSYYGHGLQIETLADIFIDNTDALNNMLFGGELTAGGQIAISNSEFSNTSTGQPTVAVGKGLEINSKGDASLASVILNNNQTVGADIQAGGHIFLDSVTAIDNGSDGIMIQGSCTHVSGGLYSGNDQYGLNLGSSALDQVSPPIFNNNTAGNINPTNPVTCPPIFGGIAPTSAGVTPAAASAASVVIPQDISTFAIDSVAPEIITQETLTPSSTIAGSSNLFWSNFIPGTVDSETASGDVDLNSYLMNTRTGSSSVHGIIFMGKYVYVHSDAGLQILAYQPISDHSVAMATP